MNKVLISVVVIALFSTACASTYLPPPADESLPQTSITVPALKADILQAAKRILILEGYRIISSDDAAGTLSTAPRNLHVSPTQANCGTTMGLDYLKDARTSTRVSFGLIAEDGRLSGNADIEGEYRPGAVTQNITLTCRSRGILERDLLTKIERALPSTK
jgi:hypothetical protein